jgi:hypothetical protein
LNCMNATVLKDLLHNSKFQNKIRLVCRFSLRPSQYYGSNCMQKLPCTAPLFGSHEYT